MKLIFPHTRLVIPIALATCCALLYFYLPILAHTPPVDDTTSVQRGFHNGPLVGQVDSIVVVKRFRHMYLFSNKKLLKVYKISLGQVPVGAKHIQGDLKTPEGLYHIDGKNPYSIAHKSLGISYPNDNDRKYARTVGKPTGGDIKIHGMMNGKEAEEEEWAKEDWTWGCIAIRNTEVDELYDHIVVGAPILILP
jgi:murein L,D-transpeptidase YafK